MVELCEKIRNLTPYAPQTADCPIRLDANESFINANELFGQEIALAVNQVDLRRYPDPTAAGVRQAFAAFYGLDPTLVTAGNGSDELICLLMNTLVQKGDRVLTVDPDFSMYGFYAHLAELDAKSLQTKDGLLSPACLVDAADRTNAKMLIFSNPCNPTSLGICRPDLLVLLEKTRQLGTLVVVDEAYMDFWDQSVLDLLPAQENLIVLKTASKAFGMAALRLGFAVASERITMALQAAKSPYNVNSLTQAVGTLLYQKKTALHEGLTKLIASRDALYAGLCALAAQKQGIGHIPKPKTNFVLVDTPLAKELWQGLQRQGILVRLFENRLRITAGSPDENAAVLRELEKLLPDRPVSPIS